MIQIAPDVLERFVLCALQNATATAALNAAHARGRDNRNFADQLAVEAMREVLNRELLVRARVMIGEGERDQAPQLYVGEELGPEGPTVLKLAVDPLEGTNLCARGEPGAVCAIAAAYGFEGDLLAGVDGYMDKLVLGADLVPRLPVLKQIIYHKRDDWSESLLDAQPEDLVNWIAWARQKSVTDVVAMVLDRPRNQRLIDELRELNAQVKLIRDGDVTAALLALDPRHDVDVAWGIGAAAEGVITAAMARVYNGYMEARWWFPSNDWGVDQQYRLQKLGLDLNRVHGAEDLASGHVMFSLTAVTANEMLPGVRYESGGAAHTWTVSGRSRTGTLNIRHTVHRRPPAAPRRWPSKEGTL